MTSLLGFSETCFITRWMTNNLSLRIALFVYKCQIFYLYLQCYKSTRNIASLLDSKSNSIKKIYIPVAKRNNILCNKGRRLLHFHIYSRILANTDIQSLNYQKEKECCIITHKHKESSRFMVHYQQKSPQN